MEQEQEGEKLEPGEVEVVVRCRPKGLLVVAEEQAWFWVRDVLTGVPLRRKRDKGIVGMVEQPLLLRTEVADVLRKVVEVATPVWLRPKPLWFTSTFLRRCERRRGWWSSNLRGFGLAAVMP